MADEFDQYLEEPGLLEPGNIDLKNRPRVRNADGSISTVRSMSVNSDGKEYLIPTVVGDKVVSDEEAIENFRKTRQHLGAFDTPANASRYAEKLHNAQAAMLEQPEDEFEQYAEVAPKPRGATADKAEAAARGAAYTTPVGTWADEAYGAGGAAAYGIAKGIRSLLPGGVPEGAPSVGDVYEKLRKQYQDRDAELFEQEPGAYRAGEVGGFLAQGGGKALLGAPSAIRAAPAAAGALLTKEGLKAAGVGAAKAAAAGAGYGAVSGAGDAEPGGRLEQAGKTAAVGALVGAPIGGFAGAAARGLTDDAAQAGKAHGAALTLDAADEAAGRVQTLNQANKEAFEAAQGQYADDAAAHAAEVERLNQQHAADVAQGASERTALQEAARARHAAEVAGIKQQHAADVAEATNARSELQSAAERQTAAAREAAEAAARAPTKDKAVRLFGLEGMKDPERARRSAEALFDEQGGQLRDKVLGLEPAKGLELMRGLKDQAGKELGGVREALAQSGAQVNIGPLLGELRESIGSLPTGAREAALNTIDDLVWKGTREGIMDPAHLRQAIDNLNVPSKFGASLPNGSVAKEAAPVFRKARAALLDLEKQLVARHLPDQAGAYDDALRRYGLFTDAVGGPTTGALGKVARENKGQPIVRYPDPEPVPPVRGPYKADVAPPELPEPPAGPYKADVAGPVLPPAPVKPRAPRTIPTPARPANEAELKEILKQRMPLTARLGREVGGAVGRGVGGLFGSPAAGAIAGRATVDSWLQRVAPSTEQLGKQAAKATARLEKFGPLLERAMAEGPRAVMVMHHMLMQNAPEYAEYFQAEPQQDEVRVQAQSSPDLAKGMPGRAPIVEVSPDQLRGVGPSGPRAKDDGHDIVSTADQDAVVLQHFRDNPQDEYARNETGWEMQQSLAGPEEGINALGAPIKGGKAHVNFGWTPTVDRVNAIVHTHPKQRGKSMLNKQNATGSKGDHETVMKGGVPNYFLSTDGKVHVLERRGGQIVERILEDE